MRCRNGSESVAGRGSGASPPRPVFTAEERDRVRERLLALAEAHPDVVGAATGSYVADGGDDWSDIDLAFAIRGDLAQAPESWARIL